MKQKILLALVSFAFITATEAQKKKDRVTAYAITGLEKGNSRWAEVNLIDVVSGEVINPVYQSKSEVKKLNARTGKPIAIAENKEDSKTYVRVNVDKLVPTVNERVREQQVIVKKNLVPTEELIETRTLTTKRTEATTKTNQRVIINKIRVSKDQPFATNSAACAFDKKHDRLYYTPMSINQLRYIDLKAKTPAVFYFEEDAFGTVKGSGDVANQITRMVIAGDGNGYALTNNADQLIQFTTDKKPVITNLGSLTDDAGNGKFSVRSSTAYGGDMVADKSGNLYLITANRRVYKISIESRVADYLGSIKGLPEGYTTNGAIVEKDNFIVVSSSTATNGYYKFDIESLQAEKISQNNSVFNASDLANANLLNTKKKKENKIPEETKKETLVKEDLLNNAVEKSIRSDIGVASRMTVYPNPITNFVARLSLTNYPEGRYEVQLVDLNGKQLNRKIVQINNKTQQLEFKLPTQLAKGTYLVRIINAVDQSMNTEKIIVQ
jgi:hypothetical protein